MKLASSSAASSTSSSSSTSLFSSSTATSTLTMLRSVNWGEKLGQVFGGHCGRILKIMIVFLCALGVLIGIYSARSQRLTKESESTNNKLSSAATPVPVASTSKWVIVANPDSLWPSNPSPSAATDPGSGNGAEYVCAVAQVALRAGWKTIIIGGRVNCCRRPECFAISQSQFLRMGYRSSAVLRNLTSTSPYPEVYKETFRNLAFLWAIHRGARYIFDAYVEEYQSAGISTFRFEEELNRQLHTLALDESLALVEERSRSRVNMFRNPYSHFGRPDVQLLPSVPGTKHSHAANQADTNGYPSYSQYMNGHTTIASKLLHEYPTYRICEVRPPSIEKFLEIDEGWWDMAAPALVLPGDTMPPLCTRNTLFAPEVFWALPLLPDYSSGDNQLPEVPQNSSRIPPWYVRGLWSQSLLEDLGGSIRLTLSKVPTLQLNKDYFFQKDKQPSSSKPSPTSFGSSEPTNSGPAVSHAATGPSKLLKRWSCRSRSTFRCLVLISKELSNSLYMSKGDLMIIDAWVKDLKSVGYSEPSMLPKRRTHANPCLGADGLLGVSFHSALVPKYELTREEYIAGRNETLKSLVTKFAADEQIRSMEKENPTRDGSGARDKRQTERSMSLGLNIMPPQKNSTYEVIDWSQHVAPQIPRASEEADEERSSEERFANKFTQQPHGLSPDSYQVPEFAKSSGTTNPRYHYKSYDELLSESDSYSQRILPVEGKPSLPNARASLQTMGASSGRNIKHFRAFLQQVAAKSAQEGHAARDFPILKAMADNICPGFGPLLPYMPQNIREDTLLIIAFTNQHYDLIPTLEVLYRSTFPNMLYCGHPHESIEIFKRKYQLVEQRAFSFLPTYTKSTYECVLGAIEMNYEVKGYQVITDETLLESWNTWKLDKEKVWISTSSHETVERSTWHKFDPSGRKLARLLEGISATWKLFSYILSGSDAVDLERKIIVRRSVTNEEEEKVEPAALLESHNHGVESGLNTQIDSSSDNASNESKESFETGETAYIQPPHPSKWNSSNSNDAQGNVNYTKNERPSDTADLQVSDWDYFKIPGLPEELNFDPLSIPAENDTDLSNNAPMEDEEILVGDEEDFGNSTDSDPMGDIIGIIQDVLLSSKSSSTTTPASVSNEEAPLDDSVPEDEDQARSLDSPTDDESMENSTRGSSDGYDPSSSNSYTESMSSSTPSTFTPESSVGVPLYHVEHIEPPTTTSWHKPDDSSTSTTSTTTRPELQSEKPIADGTNSSKTDSSNSGSPSSPQGDSSTNTESTTTPSMVPLNNTNSKSTSQVQESDRDIFTETSTGSPSVSTSSQSQPLLNLTSTTPATTHSYDHDEHAHVEIDALLDSLHEAYYNMLSIVEEYEENNQETADGTQFEGSDYENDFNYIDESPSHRIAPKEFRHIRCTKVDDGHQSDLCFILRQYITTLNENNRRDVRLYHDASPMYYIPSHLIKAFYSVANVLLHHGVMDELALPLIFRGLSLDDEWIQLNRTMDLSQPISDSTHYIYPFNLHKVYSDPNLKHDFCSKYLLKILEV